MNTISFFALVPLALTAAVLPAQNTAIFPSDYAAVPEGPENSPNLPLALGTSRVLCLYEAGDLTVTDGASITSIGYREDALAGGIDAGLSLQLEVRMGWTTNGATSMSSNFDQNFDGAATTVFGPALFTLPDLRDPQAPLADGRVSIPLSTPFDYTPNGRNLLVEFRVLGTSGGGGSFNYRLDRARFYSPVEYGADGCQHSGGTVPDQFVTEIAPGTWWYSSLSNGPANAPAFIALNIGQPMVTPFPLNLVFPGVSPTCTGQISGNGLALFGGSTGSTGGATWSMFIPNEVQWSGFTISSQVLMLDFFSPGQVVASNGAEVRIGTHPRCSTLYANGVPSQQLVGSINTNYCPVAFFDYQ